LVATRLKQTTQLSSPDSPLHATVSTHCDWSGRKREKIEHRSSDFADTFPGDFVVGTKLCGAKRLVEGNLHETFCLRVAKWIPKPWRVPHRRRPSRSSVNIPTA